jgi:ATP-dependent Clp protease ATP-binding subunit ClpC
MFERFTERARQVVVLAQEEAHTMGTNYIGSEHILIGLLREEEGLAAKVLETFGLEIEAVRASIARKVEVPGKVQNQVKCPISVRGSKVLELALREALSLGHNYIGTEHILLGMVREGEGIANIVLEEYDAGDDAVRNEVIRMLSGPRPSTVTGETTRERVIVSREEIVDLLDSVDATIAVFQSDAARLRTLLHA